MRMALPLDKKSNGRTDMGVIFSYLITFITNF